MGQRGLLRPTICVPELTPHLSRPRLGLTTPINGRVGRRLIDSLLTPTLVRDSTALNAFAIRPRGLVDAIQRALVNEDCQSAETRWSDALSSRGDPPKWGGKRFGSRIVGFRVAAGESSARVAFAPAPEHHR